jgi:hypothetical protein
MTKADIWYFVARWLELLGQNPSPARDPGIGAWHYLSQRSAQRRDRPPGQPLLDDPHLAIGIS